MYEYERTDESIARSMHDEDLEMRRNESVITPASYRPTWGIAAINVESMVRTALAGPRFIDVIGVGQDRGRTTSSIALVALRSAWGVEFASYVVDHASGTVTDGRYYEHDRIGDAWNLFALRTLPMAQEATVRS